MPTQHCKSEEAWHGMLKVVYSADFLNKNYDKKDSADFLNKKLIWKSKTCVPIQKLMYISLRSIFDDWNCSIRGPFN